MMAMYKAVEHPHNNYGNSQTNLILLSNSLSSLNTINNMLNPIDVTKFI